MRRLLTKTACRMLLPVFCCAVLLLLPASATSGKSEAAPGERVLPQVTPSLYPENTDKLTTEQCMQCHPNIAKMLRTNGAMHSRVECRKCHLQFHTFMTGKTTYEEILPKCSRCHGHKHGEELVNCSSCHVEAHMPLDIPASRPLSQGCYVCHPKLSKDINTFETRHTDLYCTACHHTKHGTIPSCLECHQQHTGTTPYAGEMRAMKGTLDQCLECHPPHKALKVAYPDDTPNQACGYCHRKAREMLLSRTTKHTALLCTQCHPGKHKTIKRCRDCHGMPHPESMIKKFKTCGGCHGVAHNVVR